MINITIQSDDPLAQLIEARAARSGRSRDDVAAEVVREGLYALIRTLHERFMRGEVSQGYMAEQLGIGRADLIHLLDALGLQVTNL
jgi:hypothetical protein